MLRSLWKSGQIFLFDKSEIPVVLGRNRDTGVTDFKCSKKQAKLSYDKAKNSIVVENLGKRCIVVNETFVPTGQKISLTDGDVLELLPGKYSYRFEKMKNDKETGVEQETPSTSEKINQNSKPGWTTDNKLLIFNSPNLENRSKIASFDLDGTLICTQSGVRFPKDENDWRILYPEIPSVLKQTHRDGFKIVVFTNQKGISLGHQSEEGFKRKIESVQSKFGVPLQCFVAVGDGFFRKPLTGMWEEMEKISLNVVVDKSKSFYVGDAAGRDEDKNRKRNKDHSNADRLFALNLGVKFFTPEEFFLKNKNVEKFSMPTFDPRKFVTKNLLEPESAKLVSETQEIIVMVGFPASGKSTFVDTYLTPQGYVTVNRDKLKSWQKCVNYTENLLKEGKSVVVDNTNPDKESRRRYVELSRSVKKIPVRCFVMNVDVDHARHNNKFRELAGLRDADHKGVNDMVIYTFRKNYQEPELSEGFDEIVRVNVVPKFDDKHLENLYSMYLLEK